MSGTRFVLSGWLLWPSASKIRGSVCEHKLKGAKVVLVVAAGVDNEESDVEGSKDDDERPRADARVHRIFAKIPWTYLLSLLS